MHVPPPLYALAAAGVQRALTRSAERPSAARSVVAGTTAAAAVSMAGASARQFRRSGTTVDPVDPARASVLVTTGVNSLSRNPMYVGLAGLLTAHGILRGSWMSLAPVVGFVLVVDRMQIPAEEAALRVLFDSDYEAYRTRVPRWLDRRSIGFLCNG